MVDEGGAQAAASGQHDGRVGRRGCQHSNQEPGTDQAHQRGRRGLTAAVAKRTQRVSSPDDVDPTDPRTRLADGGARRIRPERDDRADRHRPGPDRAAERAGELDKRCPDQPRSTPAASCNDDTRSSGRFHDRTRDLDNGSTPPFSFGRALHDIVRIHEPDGRRVRAAHRGWPVAVAVPDLADAGEEGPRGGRRTPARTGARQRRWPCPARPVARGADARATWAGPSTAGHAVARGGLHDVFNRHAVAALTTPQGQHRSEATKAR